MFDGKRVLELGAGTGLNSILIDRIFSPKKVIVTDHESHVALIEKNLENNNCNPRTAAAPLDWCNLGDRPEKNDIVLAFECVYNEELYEPFIAALESTTDENSIIFIGLTRTFSKPLFFETLRAHGFKYTLLPQEALPADYRNESSGRDVGMFLCSRSSSLP
jgi:predicted nicotinamide N-methyase